MKRLVASSAVAVAALTMSLPGGTTIEAAEAQTKHTAKEVPDVSVMAYNVYMLPRTFYPGWGQVQRGDLIAQSEFIKRNDIVILNEVFDNKASDNLLTKLKNTYPHQTPVSGRSKHGWDGTEGSYSHFSIEDGGVAIVSKYPIVKKVQHVYKNACGHDYLSNKGFVYAKIMKDDKPVHVVGTHMQAEDEKCKPATTENDRTQQLKAMRDFVDNQKIPKDEMVVLGGDFNVIKDTKEYKNMLNLLKVSEPEYIGHDSTWDTKTNSIAKYNYPNLDRQYLDYVFLDKDHAQPKHWSNEALLVHSEKWQERLWFKNYEYNDYSDHYPVVGSTNGK